MGKSNFKDNNRNELKSNQVKQPSPKPKVRLAKSKNKAYDLEELMEEDIDYLLGR